MNTEHLYHYTSAHALANILNHSYLRATQAWHLADGSECRHAIDTLRLIDPGLNSYVLWKSLETALLSTPRYVVCFSKVRNDAYQWKHYGEDGTGACIVFDPQKIKNTFQNSSWEHFECHYDQGKQILNLKTLADDLKERGNKAIAERITEFWKWNIQFKRENFFQENEVRFVFSAQAPVNETTVKRDDFEMNRLESQCAQKLNSYSHPSACFDEKCRPFEPFCIRSAIAEIILGPRFTTTQKYWQHLSNNYSITQI